MSEHQALSCAQAEAELSQYLDGELTPQAHAAVDAHLQECARCRQFCETLRQMIEACRQASRPTVDRECLRRAAAAARAELARRGLI